MGAVAKQSGPLVNKYRPAAPAHLLCDEAKCVAVPCGPKVTAFHLSNERVMARVDAWLGSCKTGVWPLLFFLPGLIMKRQEKEDDVDRIVVPL